MDPETSDLWWQWIQDGMIVTWTDDAGAVNG